jgi:multiple antibiotic resistance protein
MPPHPLIDLAINSLVTFFVIIDPLGLIAIFNGLADGLGAADRRRLAFRGTGIGAGVLLLFALGGERLLAALGIALPAFRAAGGAMLFMIAYEMTFQNRQARREATAQPAAREPNVDDLSIFPLAIPLLAGPGAITSALLLSSRYRESPVEEGIVLAAMMFVMLVTLATFLAAERLGRLIGPTLAQIATRLLGILLAAVAVEYIVVGIRQIWESAS